MNQFNTSNLIAALFPELPGDPKAIRVISQGGRGNAKWYSGIGGRFAFALMENDGAGGALYDVTNFSTITLVIFDANGTYVLKTLNAPFANITDEQWSSGIRPSGQHFLFQFTSDELLLNPGTYKLGIFGNTADPTAANDFYVECAFEVLASGIPGPFVGLLNDQTLYQALLDTVIAKLGDYVKKVGAPGDTITLTSGDGAVKRILGITNDAALGAQRVDDLEYPQ